MQNVKLASTGNIGIHTFLINGRLINNYMEIWFKVCDALFAGNFVKITVLVFIVHVMCLVYYFWDCILFGCLQG